jgi:hypothetical protein
MRLSLDEHRIQLSRLSVLHRCSGTRARRPRLVFHVMEAAYPTGYGVVKVGQICDDFCTPLQGIYTIFFLVSIRTNVSTHLKLGGRCCVLIL